MSWGDYHGGYFGGTELGAYLRQLQQLLPPGKAWPRDDDALLTTTADALSAEFSNVEERAAALLTEADVRTTTELLTEWETFADLPGAYGALAATTEGRQANLHAKLTQQASSSIPALTDIAERLGYTGVSIREDGLTPFRVGYSAVGDPLQQGWWIFHFTVIGVRPATLSDDDRLYALIDEAKPAYTTFGLEIT